MVITHLEAVLGSVSIAGGIALGSWRAARKGVRKLDTIDGLTAIASDLATVAKLAPAIAQVVEDFHGVPDRPGVPGRQGVMPAIAELREASVETLQRLSRVEKAVHPNGGSSMADKVNKIAQVTGATS